MVVGPGTDLRHQGLADVLSHRFTLDLGGQVVTRLGRRFMERAQEQVQAADDLTVEVSLPEF